MKRTFLRFNSKRLFLGAALVLTSIGVNAQATNVFDNVIAVSPEHTSLKLALETAMLDDDLQDPMMNYTVFAPTNAAFDQAVLDLGLASINDLLMLPTQDLADILLYHVLDSEVPAAAVMNGATPLPMNTSNTIKLTVDGSNVYANQSPISSFDVPADNMMQPDNGVVHVLDEVILADLTVVDVALQSAAHTSLVQAVIAARLLPALTDPHEEYTVFAPTDVAFNQAVLDLGLASVNDLLLLPTQDLADILLYHVLDTKVPAAAVMNGATPLPMNTSNTIKLTVDGTDVYANQAPISAVDVTVNMVQPSNGVVHVLDEVILADLTVVDVALQSAAHTSLVQAVIAARLLPALTDPHEEYTVFAPTNTAFDQAVLDLGLVSVNDLLLLPTQDLADILLYHVLDTEVPAAAVMNGATPLPMNTSNTIKLTVDGTDVYANQAPISAVDVPVNMVQPSNGVVHVLDEVILADLTVVDVALSSPAHTSLVQAVIEARLLPALTDPHEEYTVFAPTNTAFDNAVTALGLADINALLASSDLTSILLYHVLGSEFLAADLTNGMLPTLNGQSVTIDISGPTVNTSNITSTDVPVNMIQPDNGVVHVIDAVLVPSLAGLEEDQAIEVNVYPNPTSDIVNIDLKENDLTEVIILDMNGKVVLNKNLNNNSNAISTSSLDNGSYILVLKNESNYLTKKLKIVSDK